MNPPADFSVRRIEFKIVHSEYASICSVVVILYIIIPIYIFIGKGEIGNNMECVNSIVLRSLF